MNGRPFGGPNWMAVARRRPSRINHPDPWIAHRILIRLAHVNVDRILETLNRHQVAYLLIGGMNFLLRHLPVLTFDVDLWIADNAANRQRCERALAELHAQWGRDDQDWKPVSQHLAGWLECQPLFCLTSPHGAIDIFRSVAGLGSWDDSRATSVASHTASGVAYVGLSDDDMLVCQDALEEGPRKREWIETLNRGPSASEMRIMHSEFKAAEEARRDRHWDPAVRWQVLQDTIQWAEAQAARPRNTQASRLAEQRQKLACWKAED